MPLKISENMKLNTKIANEIFTKFALLKYVLPKPEIIHEHQEVHFNTNKIPIHLCSGDIDLLPNQKTKTHT